MPSSNMIGETNFRNKWLLSDRQIANICKLFTNKDSAINKQLSRILLSKIVKSGQILGIILGPLLKAGSPLTKKFLYH